MNLYFSVKSRSFNVSLKNVFHTEYTQVCYQIFFLSLEAFTATEMNDMFSSRQPRQDVKFCRRFGEWLRSHLQDAGSLVEPQLIPDISCGSIKPSATPCSLSPKRRRSVAFWWTICSRIFHWNFLSACFLKYSGIAHNVTLILFNLHKVNTHLYSFYELCICISHMQLVYA
jgi:hypothetical protein